MPDLGLLVTDLGLLVNLLQLAVEDRTQLALENIALRRQLAIYKRSIKRPNIKVVIEFSG